MVMMIIELQITNMFPTRFKGNPFFTKKNSEENAKAPKGITIRERL